LEWTNILLVELRGVGIRAQLTKTNYGREGIVVDLTTTKVGLAM